MRDVVNKAIYPGPPPQIKNKTGITLYPSQSEEQINSKKRASKRTQDCVLRLSSKTKEKQNVSYCIKEQNQ